MAKARREKGLSQSALAAEFGCKQPALSAFEAGNPTKLSEEAVKKIAAYLGVSLETVKNDTVPAISNPPFGMETILRGFCPNCACPSNVPYVVGGHLFFKTTRTLASPLGGIRCALCGEVLETRCPTCGSPLNEGACCGVCGAPYVVNTLPDGIDFTAYALARREELAALRRLF